MTREVLCLLARLLSGYLSGMVCLDVAMGLYPRRRWRAIALGLALTLAINIPTALLR
jgi:hypothetical protein